MEENRLTHRETTGMSKRFPGWNSPEAEIDAWIEAKYPGHYERKAEVASETGLWDRLRADLNNLGAAYGELPTTSDDYWSCGYCQTAGIRSGDECECGPAMTAQSVPTTLEIVTLGLDGNYVSPATSQRRDSEPVDNLSPTDRNAYFDGIILAARKKREEQYRVKQPALLALVERWMIEDANLPPEPIDSEPLSVAMSRPLTFEPRVGWKGGPSDE